MKLLHSPMSPFVRKVLVVAHERGVASSITLVPAAAHPVERDRTVIAHNPAGKVPTLILDDGKALYDSRVIAEYLDSLAGGPNVFPSSGKARFDALVLQSLADEMAGAGVLLRYETFTRPENLRWQGWIDGQRGKLDDSIDTLERLWTQHLETATDIGTIAAGCALGYMDLRFPDLNWRARSPRLAAWHATFAERPSMVATAPK